VQKGKSFDFGITTLMGARFSVLKYLLSKYGYDKKYQKKVIYSSLISLVVSLLAYADKIVFALKGKPKNLKDPVFVLGHWRSGTTFLHNLLCLDKDTAFCTTYQTVFPNNLFAFQWFFKPIMKMAMPSHRPVDNVELNPNYPQEEEFALNNEIPFSFYNWWYFPKKTRAIADEYLLDKTTSQKDWDLWSKNFKRFVQRCILNTNGRRFISKNPPHTARIPQLLKLYPNAKFIFIHRNPYEVVRSTNSFYKSILEGIKLQDIEDEQLLDDILEVYRSLIEKYYEDSNLIPEKNRFEVRYGDLVNDPKHIIKSIYQDLLQDDFTRVEKPLTAFVEGLSHQLKEYKYQPEFIEKVNAALGEIIKKQDYDLLD
jgi:hypothetical protein